MDKFCQISTELLPFIYVENWFQCSILFFLCKHLRIDFLFLNQIFVVHTGKCITSIWWYLRLLPVLHRQEVTDIGVNILYRKTCHMPKGI